MSDITSIEDALAEIDRLLDERPNPFRAIQKLWPLAQRNPGLLSGVARERTIRAFAGTVAFGQFGQLISLVDLINDEKDPSFNDELGKNCSDAIAHMLHHDLMDEIVLLPFLLQRFPTLKDACAANGLLVHCDVLFESDSSTRYDNIVLQLEDDGAGLLVGCYQMERDKNDRLSLHSFVQLGMGNDPYIMRFVESFTSMMVEFLQNPHLPDRFRPIALHEYHIGRQMLQRYHLSVPQLKMAA